MALYGYARASTAAKARGIYKGRRPRINAVEVRRLKAEGMGPPSSRAVWTLAGRRSADCWREYDCRKMELHAARIRGNRLLGSAIMDCWKA